MLRWISLEHVGPAPQLRVDFAPRINVLTGDNGLGKSFLLDVGWWTLTRGWVGHPALPQPGASAPSIQYVVRGRTRDSEPATSQYDPRYRSWSTPRGAPPQPGVVIYARVDGSFAVWDPARNYGRRGVAGSADDEERPEPYLFDDAALWNGLSIGDRRPCEGIIRDWVGWQKAKEEQFDTLVRILDVLSTPDEPIRAGTPVRVSTDDGFDTPTISTRYGQVPLTYASAGVRRVVGLAYLLVWAWREHQLASTALGRDPEHRVVVLVDEPETHLHPRWQRLILPATLRAIEGLVGEGREVQIVAATHSALVLASLEPVFDEATDSLVDLQLTVEPGGRHSVNARRLPWRRLGDVNAWLTSEAFDLGSPRSAQAELALAEATEVLANAQIDRARALAVDAKLRGLLGDSDPFWIRWQYVLERRGVLP